MSHDETYDCPICGGRGKVLYMISEDDSDMDYCDTCEGKGSITVQVWSSEENMEGANLFL